MEENRRALDIFLILRGECMTLQYEIAGGQLILDKVVFTKELLSPDSLVKNLIYPKQQNQKKPKVMKEDNLVRIDFNHGSEVTVNEGFYDMFKKLKQKYLAGVKGNIVIRISAFTSYYVTLDMNAEDDTISYES